MGDPFYQTSTLSLKGRYLSLFVKMATMSLYNFSFTPLVQRSRPQTSLPPHHQSFAASPRIRSAVVTMPRSHVSIARFYDWSEDLGECVSVSKFYRDLAVASQKHDKVKPRNKCCSKGAHMNPGRMFLRDKAGLTKGEREIIEGIYRNRGDLPKESENFKSYNFKDEWDFVRSHKDAWMIGKQLQRQDLKCDPSLHLKLPEYLFSRMSENKSNSTGELCKICDANLSNDSDFEENRTCFHWKSNYPTAPPTTPDTDPREFDFLEQTQIKKKSIQRFRYEQEKQSEDQRSRVVKSVDESLLNARSRDKSDKKKLFVNVFLPRIPSDATTHDYPWIVDSRTSSFLKDYSRNGTTPRVSKTKNESVSYVNSFSVARNQNQTSKSQHLTSNSTGCE